MQFTLALSVCCEQQMRAKKRGGVVRAKTLSQELQTKVPAGGVAAGKKCIKVKYL